MIALARRPALWAKALAPKGATARFGLFLDFAPALGRQDVPDPFYGGPEGFALVLDLVEKAADALVDRLAAERP